MLTDVAKVEPGRRALGPGDTGNDVEELQRFLGAPVTGVYDSETEERVRGCQQRMGLRVDGLTTYAVWVTLGFIKKRKPKYPLPASHVFGTEDDSDYNGELESDQDLIRRIQEKLGIAVTGVYDTRMKVAVMRWQRANRFPATGLFGQDEWFKMF